ncbi:TPA: DNA cytosine methyltransferase [Stenotrophomonas maltophilia]
MKADPTEHRTSLRLTAAQHQAIEKLCHQDGGKIPMSAWIARAIEDKIERDLGLADRSSANESGRHTFYEFFAGGGMARAGLGNGWSCLFANDFEPMKGRAYRENWAGGHDLLVDDVNNVTSSNLPGQADLVWASFPCQDLSLAGSYKGIGHWQDKEQTRSGTFWTFWRLMRELVEEKRAPKVIVLENVYGVLTSNEGKDFSAIGSAFSGAGYRFGAMVVDARHFVPQSRPRVFIVGVRPDVQIPSDLRAAAPLPVWHPPRMVEAHRVLTKEAKKNWVWWNLAAPPKREKNFVDIIEDVPTGVQWDSPERTQQLLDMMSDANLKKVRAAQKAGKKVVGGVYKRTRLDETGAKVQRAEVRFDDIAGCLRTPAGGSSRQSILVVEGKKIRSRLLSPREAARLMGLPDTYRLPNNYNDAYHIAGDGVAVPAVSHLARKIFEPLLTGGIA